MWKNRRASAAPSSSDIAAGRALLSTCLSAFLSRALLSLAAAAGTFQCLTDRGSHHQNASTATANLDPTLALISTSTTTITGFLIEIARAKQERHTLGRKTTGEQVQWKGLKSSQVGSHTVRARRCEPIVWMSSAATPTWPPSTTAGAPFNEKRKYSLVNQHTHLLYNSTQWLIVFPLCLRRS